MDITTNGQTLILGGGFDVRSTAEVRGAIYELLRRSRGDVVLDISRVDSIDVTALKVIAAASRRAKRAQRHVILRGACPAVRRMLHLTHLIRVVELERERLAV